MSESVILCEGFHDRAFWAGWLTHLGCSDEGYRPGTLGYPALDPWKAKVVGGQFAYLSPQRNFLRVVPCGGMTKLLPQAHLRLQQRVRKALARLVINVDPDVSVATAGSGATGLKVQDVLHLARQFDPAAAANADGEIEIDGGATKISLVRWEANDPSTPGVPDQQTLERLVCSALIAAYPDRAKPVRDWLNSRPTAPAAGPKEHAWSYMAGWHAENGCENFYNQMWQDPRVVHELKTRLSQGTAWHIVQLLTA